ncbi:hypothetical protein SZ25_00577 [Candidatus Arcanobacter lacustris]|uniref:DnaA N-terminal domain-containing protein n=1 Tax=Candidatus Arcanibacter lacustris TaxID=1607817 RepID=A0A0F5MP52_9RICK|nr:hypothetical protein SZ25_00577 [Candidatus Arcanobacter lacustris]
MTKLLIQESCLIFQPTLAKRFGLNEAIILQQLHYWTISCKKEREGGHIWIYNTYSQWQKQFPFWSEVTVKRIIKSLESQEVIFSKSGKNRQDKTKFYAVNYSKISEFNQKQDIDKHDQIDQLEGSKRSVRQINLISSYNIETKTTTKEHLSKNNMMTTTAVVTQENLDRTENTNLAFKASILKSTNSFEEKSHEREMIDIWNNIFKEEGREEVVLTDSRKISLRKSFSYFKDDLAKWTSYCQKICSSKFLMGEVTNFKASLDWCIREDIIMKILEGNYKCGDRAGVKKTLTQNISETKPKSSDPLWIKVVEKLKQHYGEAITISWFNDLDFKRINKKEISLYSNNKFILNTIEGKYLNQISSIFSEVSHSDINQVTLQYSCQ